MRGDEAERTENGSAGKEHEHPENESEHSESESESERLMEVLGFRFEEKQVLCRCEIWKHHKRLI